MTGHTHQPPPPPGTAFVGRERELASLLAALADAISGHGRVVLVSGEPGIGKTRLAEEFAAYAAAEGAEVRWGRCREGAGAPAFWPWIQILRAQFTATDAADLRAQLGTGVEEIVRLVPDLHERLRGVPAVPLADDGGARFRLLDSVARFLRARAAGQALVLILEDLHWAQPAAVELLRFLIDEMQEARILVIATYRDVEVSEHHALSVVLQSPSYPPQVQRVALAGLGEEEIGQLIEALGHESSAVLVARIHRESGGNPFFAAEIVRGLGTAEVGIPGNVRDAISHRLRRLSEGCRRLLGIASVIGPEFEFATLERVAAELGDYRPPLQPVSEAQGARIVVEIPGAVGRGYRFAHALIRDVLYTALPLEERLHLHWHVAVALEVPGGPDRERAASVLAHHFSEAITGCTYGAPRQACIDKAVQYAIQAAKQATVMCAYDEAVVRYERALRTLEQWAADRRRQCELLLAMGEAQVQAGAKYAVRSETFHRAAALAREVGDPQFLARAALGVGRRTWYADAATPTHVALLEEALEAMGPHDSVERARLLGCLVVAKYLPDPRVHSVPLSAEALAIARRVGDPRTLGFALFSRCLALTEMEHTEERLRLATEVRELGDQVGDVELKMYGRLFRFTALLTLGQVATVERELAEYARLADDLREPYFRSRGVAVRAATVLIAGRFAEAEQLAREALRLIHDGEERLVLSGYGRQLYLIYWEQDRLDEIEAPSRGASAPRRDGFEVGGIWRVWRHAFSGRVEEARSEIEYLRAPDLESMPRDMSWFFFVVGRAAVCIETGDTARAAALYALLEPYARYVVLTTGPTCWGSLALVLGRLANIMGRWDDALRHLDDALAVHRRMQSPPWIAYTEWAVAKTLVARNGPGDSARAAALLTGVLKVTERLAMRRLQRYVNALRQRMGEPPDSPLLRRSSGQALVRGDKEGDRAAPEPPNATFRKEGDYWVIGYKVPAFRLKDRLGLQYLSALLNDSGREFLAIDLVAAVQGGRGDSTPDEPPHRVTVGACEPPLDQQAHREYAQRLRDLRAVVEEANAFNDRERASRAQAEIDALTDELRRGMGLGRRIRPSGAPAERARASVTHAIKAALRAITEHDPALGQYLAATIKTGTFCSYRPDPRVAMVWV